VKVRAERWIFGRIGRDLSPTGRLGFQTLWATNGLLAETLKELERVASSFDVAQESRLQFFHLSDGRFVLTAVRSSRDHRTVDRDGRQAFLCFGWIFELAELNKFQNHPFAVYPPIEHLQDVPMLLKTLGKPGTPIEPEFLACRSPDPIRPRLPQEILDLLVIAAFRTGRGAAVDRPIHLLGTPDECAVLLNWIFSHVPPAARIRCTFSTQTDQCSIPSRRFWAAGRTVREGQRSAFEVAISSGTVRGDTSCEKKAPDVRRYFRWLEGRKESRLPLDQELVDIDLVIRALDGESEARSSQIRNAAFVADLVEFYHQDVVDELVHRLSLVLPKRPGLIVAEALLSREEPGAAGTVLDLLAQGIHAIKSSKLRDILEPGWVELPLVLRWWFKLRLFVRPPRLQAKRSRASLAEVSNRR